MNVRRRIAMAERGTGERITDHMLVRYLAHDMDFDVETLRRRVVRVATGILDENPDIANFMKSGEYIIKSNGLVFRFRAGKTRTTLITITGNRRNRGVLSNRALRIRSKHDQKDRKNK